MRVVFMGTPDFAARVLEALLASTHEVAAVVTRPDAVRARGKKLVASPVKELAASQGVPVLEYSSLRSEEAYSTLEALEADAFCVAAYGAILPKRVLDLPRHGCLNVHGSLLPRWRGAAPVERAILAGDEQTGIGIMRMEEGLDTGAVTAVRTVPIGSTPADELSARLAAEGGQALVEVLDALDAGVAIDWAGQPDEGATYAEKIAKGELDIAPELPVAEAARRVRASGASHTSRCALAGRPLTVLGAHAAGAGAPSVQPGKIAFVAKRLYVGCADGVLEITGVKPDGKKPMDAKAFAAGVQGIKTGTLEWQGL